MRFCTQCGSALAPGSRYCPQCGAALRAAGPAPGAPPPLALTSRAGHAPRPVRPSPPAGAAPRRFSLGEVVRAVLLYSGAAVLGICLSCLWFHHHLAAEHAQEEARNQPGSAGGAPAIPQPAADEGRAVTSAPASTPAALRDRRPAEGPTTQQSSITPQGGVLEVQGMRMEFAQGSLGRTQSVQVDVLARLPEPACPLQSLVSSGYAVKLDEIRLSRPASITLRFDRSRLPSGATDHSIYPVLAHGRYLERLEAERVDVARQEVVFRVNRTVARVHADSDAPVGASFFAVAADAASLAPVLQTPECTIWGAGGTLDSARTQAQPLSDAYKWIRSQYTGMGFVPPTPVSIHLLPLRGVNGYAAGSTVLINLNAWDGTDASRSTLAHETFHLIQEASCRGFESSQMTINEENWAAEATAQWMAYKLYPGSARLAAWVKGLGPEFCYTSLFMFVPVAEGENPDVPAHQYQSFIFFAYLDTLYDVAKIIRAIYPGADGGTSKPAANLHCLLEQYVATTPDRAGKTHTLADIYVDFLVHYAVRKDFEPLATHFDPQKLGGKGALRLPPAGGEYHTGWNIPYEEGNKRQMTKTFSARAMDFCVVRAYNISSMTSKKLREEGDLTIKLEAPGSNRARMVVFPHKGGLKDPRIGLPQQPVTLNHWEALDGALVWVVETGEAEGETFRLTASMNASTKEEEPEVWIRKGPEIVGDPKEVARFSIKDNSLSYVLHDWILINTSGAVYRVSLPEGKPPSGSLTWDDPPARLRKGDELTLTLKATLEDKKGVFDAAWWTCLGYWGTNREYVREPDEEVCRLRMDTGMIAAGRAPDRQTVRFPFIGGRESSRGARPVIAEGRQLREGASPLVGLVVEGRSGDHVSILWVYVREKK